MSDNVLTPKKAFFKVLPVIIAVVIIFLIAVILASVKSSVPNPTISDKDSAYLTIGGYKITKDRLYTYLRKDYGITELSRLVDEKLLESVEISDTELEKYVIETLFNVEYDSEYDYSTGNVKDYHNDASKVWDEAIDSLVIYGQLKESERTNTASLKKAFRNFFELDAKRQKAAENYFWTQLAADTVGSTLFPEHDIEHYYSDNYKGTSTGIFIPFNSAEEAKKVMTLFGISTDSTVLSEEDGWVKSSYDPLNINSEKVFLTTEEVLEAFVNMYNFQMSRFNNGNDILDNSWYTLEESSAAMLDKAASGLTIATDVSVESFKLPTVIHTVGDLDNPDITLTYEVRAYTSGQEIPATLSEVDGEGNITATLTLPQSGTSRFYLDITFTYQGETKQITKTIKLTPHTEESAEVVNSAKDVEHIYYLVDSSEIAEVENDNDIVKFEFDYAYLSGIDSTLASYLQYDSTKLSVSDLKTKFYKAYTIEPVSGDNYTYLILKLSETAPTELISTTDSDYSEKTAEEIQASDALRSEIIEKLKKDRFTDNMVTKIIYELRTKSNLKIHDRYLDAVYNYNYSYFFNTTLSQTDYLTYNLTDKGDKKIVAEFRVGDKTVQITADELYNSMESRYGVSVASAMIDDYILLDDKKFNDIYNPYTMEKIDSAEVKELLNSEVNNVRKNFEYDYFTNAALASYGFIPAFSSDYGWTNFRNDYFGAFSDEELLVNANFGGTAYSDAKTLFQRSLYAEYSKVKAVIDEKYADYFSATVLNLVISLDENFDGNPDTNIVTGKEEAWDEETTWTAETKALAVELGELFKQLAPQTGKATLSEQMTELVNIYNQQTMAIEEGAATAYDTIFSYNYFAKFIKAGLRVKWETANTYTNSSSIVEEFADKVREVYQTIKENGNLGEDLAAPFYIEPFETSYGYHLVVVTSTQEPAEIPSNSEAIIAKYAYTQLLEREQEKMDSYDAKVSLTDEEQEFIDTWYTPAKDELTSTKAGALKLIENRLDETLLAKITFENNTNLDRYKEINNILKKAYEEE